LLTSSPCVSLVPHYLLFPSHISHTLHRFCEQGDEAPQRRQTLSLLTNPIVLFHFFFNAGDLTHQRDQHWDPARSRAYPMASSRESQCVSRKKRLSAFRLDPVQGRKTDKRHPETPSKDLFPVGRGDWRPSGKAPHVRSDKHLEIASTKAGVLRKAMVFLWFQIAT